MDRRADIFYCIGVLQCDSQVCIAALIVHANGRTFDRATQAGRGYLLCNIGTFQCQGTAVPLDVVVVGSCTFRYHFAVFVCCGVNDTARTSGKRHASHINGIRLCRQRRGGQHGQAEQQDRNQSEQSFHHKGSSFAGQRVPGGAAARPTAPKGHSPHHGYYLQHTIFRQKKKPESPVSLQILQLLPQRRAAAAGRHPVFYPVTPAAPGGSGRPGRL